MTTQVVGTAFGCFCDEAFVPVEGAADGPLRGLTFAVKDLIDTRGAVTGAGNPDWRRSHNAATEHAPVVRQLLDAGATLVGRTVTDELAFSLEGNNHFYGTPRNPAAPDRLPGGSSSGSAVAVAAGLVDFSLGTDTGGSVRVPAAFCGIYGFRPSHGVVPTVGVMSFAPSLDTVGWFARDAAMLAKVGDILLPPSEPQAISRVFVAGDALALVDANIRQGIEDTVRRLPWPATEINLFPVPFEDVARCYQITQSEGIIAALGPWLKAARPTFGPNIAPRFAGIYDHSAADCAAADELRRRLRAHWLDFFAANPGAVIAVPSAPCTALRRDLPDEALGAFYQRALAIGGIASLVGLPQISIPFEIERFPAEGKSLMTKGIVSGGFGLIGAPNVDRTILSV
jgi:amidase